MVGRFLSFLLVALPMVSLALNVVSWLKFGVDMPYWDDWRQYVSGDMGRLDLAYLMTPSNDTIYAVGLFLDSMAVRFLSGNTVAYQLLSMVGVLGSLLLLQWRLLCLCTDDRRIVICSFGVTVLMLQPDTYWGLQNMAFHQAVPLVCVLASLLMALDKQWKLSWTVPVLVGLGLISGFSYISGAFSILSLSLTLLFVQRFIVGLYRQRILMAGLSLLGPGILSTLAQVWVIVGVQHGTHLANVPMAYPWESDFWLFLLGKIARALMLPLNQPKLSFIVALVVVSVVICAFVGAFINIWKRQRSDRSTLLSVVFICLVVVIVVYLMLVAAGRTNIRSVDVQAPLDIFLFGFERFHFFWVTLLWPWLVALFLSWLFQLNINAIFSGGATVGVSVILLLMAKYSGLLSHGDFYQLRMKSQLEGVACVQKAIQSPGRIYCQGLYSGDLSQAISNGRNIDASFVRFLSYIPLPLGSGGTGLLYRMSSDIDNVQLLNASRENSSESSLAISAAFDPQLLFLTGKAELMRNCRALEVGVRIKAAAPDIAQLFFLPLGKEAFSEEDSQVVYLDGGGEVKTIYFNIFSKGGFSDSLRFDPVASSQNLSVEELEVRCRSLIAFDYTKK